MVAGVPIQMYDSDASQAISLFNACKTFGQLPQSGAILEQDSYLMWVLSLVEKAYAEKEKLENERAKSKRR